MSRYTPALIVIILVVMAGCFTDNDKNTINSLPKTHDVFPVFYVKIDNGFNKYGVDSVLLNVVPSIGWEDEVYSDTNGFIGTMAAGTYITDIDTVVEINPVTQQPDTTYDTTSVTYGFQPSAPYTFSFSHESEFFWTDAFRAIYAITVDSTWTQLNADTLRVSTEVDHSMAFDTLIRRVVLIKTPTDTSGNTPDSVGIIDVPIGYWFDTSFVLTDPSIVENFPPDSADIITQSWAYWFKIDTFFRPRDSILYCDVDSIKIRKDTADVDNNDFVSWTLDTTFYFHICPQYPALRNAIYSTWGWSGYDTTVHAVFPDSSKSLIFDQSGIRIVNHEVDDTNQAVLYLNDITGINPINGLEMQLTMPPIEVYPFYEILIRDEGGK